MTDSRKTRNWSYGKCKRIGNTFVQEILVFIPKDPFLPETILKKGARGKTIVALRKRLMQLYRNGDIPKSPFDTPPFDSYFRPDYYSQTWECVKAYLEKETAEGGKLSKLRGRYDARNYDVDREIWESMGLTIADHLDEMFEIKSNAGNGATTINVKLEEDTITIEYRLSIYIERPDKMNGRKVSVPLNNGLERRHYEDYIKKAIEGIYRWKNDTPAIQGVTPQINIKIFDKNNNEFMPIWNSPGNLSPSTLRVSNFAVDSKKKATVYIEEDYTGKLATMVPDNVGWRKSRHLQIHVRNPNKPHERTKDFDRLIEHEFGHVLGLFDAYGYRNHFGPLGDVILPEAKIDNIHVEYNSVMLDRRVAKFKRTATDLAMILYAWQENKLQCYIKSVMGSQSQAYYH